MKLASRYINIKTTHTPPPEQSSSEEENYPRLVQLFLDKGKLFDVATRIQDKQQINKLISYVLKLRGDNPEK